MYLVDNFLIKTFDRVSIKKFKNKGFKKMIYFQWLQNVKIREKFIILLEMLLNSHKINVDSWWNLLNFSTTFCKSYCIIIEIEIFFIIHYYVSISA